MTEAVVIANQTPLDLDLLKRTVAKGTSDDEFGLFVQVCQRTGLDPFARQIYAVKRYDSKERKDVMQTQISIDGARLTAQRSTEYAGQTPTYWCGKDSQWIDVWLDSEHPAAAKVGVYRKGFAEPLWAVATWEQYVQTYKKDSAILTSPMWVKMGPLMLGKCAEMLALRKAFPMELSGLYTPEEMGQADNETPVAAEHEPIITKRPPPVVPYEPIDDITDAEIIPTPVTESTSIYEPPAGQPLLTEPQGKNIGRLFGKLNIKTREDRLEFLTEHFSHPFDSSKQLLKSEATSLISHLMFLAGETEKPRTPAPQAAPTGPSEYDEYSDENF